MKVQMLQRISFFSQSLFGGGAGNGFFSVQRLHGFRQVVTHVQSQQKDEL